MESNQDPIVLAQQIQALAATVEEFTRQNQEMKLLLQQEVNQSKGNQEDEENSQGRGDRQRPISPDDQNSNLLRDEEGDGWVKKHYQREDGAKHG